MKYKIYCLSLLFLVFTSCKQDKKNFDNSRNTSRVQPKGSYSYLSDEILLNTKFNSWDTESKPTKWNINPEIKDLDSYIIDRDSLNHLIIGNKIFPNYLKQTVKVKPNTFYIASCQVMAQLNSNTQAGLIVYADDKKIGAKMFKLSDEGSYKILFNSLNNNEVTYYIGYLELGGGRIEFSNLSLKEVELNNNNFESEVAQQIYNDLSLNFSDTLQFEASVEKVIRHLSYLILTDDIKTIAQKDQLMSKLPEDSNLKTYLKSEDNQRTQFFTTKIINSTIEILDEFNIGTKEVKLLVNNDKTHVFLQYYNPHSQTWIVLDPHFNSRLSRYDNFNLTNENQISYLNLGGLGDKSELINKYKKTQTQIRQEQILGYPF